MDDEMIIKKKSYNKTDLFSKFGDHYVRFTVCLLSLVIIFSCGSQSKDERSSAFNEENINNKTEDDAAVEQYVLTETDQDLKDIPSLSSFQDEPFSGNAGVSIDFDTSPTMGPKIGISYSSLRAGGERSKPHERVSSVGLGWAVKGISWGQKRRVVIDGVAHDDRRWNGLSINYPVQCRENFCSHIVASDSQGSVTNFGAESGFGMCNTFHTACNQAYANPPTEARLCNDLLLNLMNPYQKFDVEDHEIRTRVTMATTRDDRWGNRVRYFYETDHKIEEGKVVTKHIRIKKIVWGVSNWKAFDSVVAKQIELSKWASKDCRTPPTTDIGKLREKLAEIETALNQINHIEMDFIYDNYDPQVPNASSESTKRLAQIELRKVEAGCIKKNSACNELIRGWKLTHKPGLTADDRRPYLATIAEYRSSPEITKPPMKFTYYPYAEGSKNASASMLRHVDNGYGGRIDFSYHLGEYTPGILSHKTMWDHQGKIVEHSYARYLSTKNSYVDRAYAGSRYVVESVMRSPEAGESTTATCRQTGKACIPVKCIERRFYTNGFEAGKSYNYMDNSSALHGYTDDMYRALSGELYQEIHRRPRADGFCGNAAAYLGLDTWPHGRYAETRRYFKLEGAGIPYRVQLSREIQRQSKHASELNPADWNKQVEPVEERFVYDQYMNKTTHSVWAYGGEQKRIETSYKEPAKNGYGHKILLNLPEKVRTLAMDPYKKIMTLIGEKKFFYARNAMGTETGAVEKEELRLGPNPGCNEAESDVVQTTNLTYTSNGMPKTKVIGEPGKLQITESWTYDPIWWFLKSQASKGPLKSAFLYNSKLDLEKKKGPYISEDLNSLVDIYTYDELGRLKKTQKQRDAYYESVGYSFDTNGRFKVKKCQVRADVPQGPQNTERCTHITYGAWNKVIKVQDPSGAIVDTDFDMLGREVSKSAKRFSGAPTKYTTTRYNVQENSTVVITANGNYIQTCEGRKGSNAGYFDVVEIRTGKGSPISCSKTPPNAVRTRTYYNALGVVRAREELPFGASSGQLTRYIYDGAERLRGVSDALREQQLAQNITNGRSAHVFDLNWRDNPIRLNDPDRGTTFTCYHAAGPKSAESTGPSRAAAKRMGTDEWIYYKYDAARRLISQTRPDGSTSTDWDGNSGGAAGKIGSQLYKENARVGVSRQSQLTVEHDSLGRPKSRSLDGRGVSYQYSGFHDVICEYYNQANQSVRYSLDKAGQVQSISSHPCQCSQFCPGLSVASAITYAANGKPLTAKFGDSSSQNRQYEASGRLKQIQYIDPSGVTKRNFLYRYDDAKDGTNISVVEDTVAKRLQIYNYDYANRLAESTQILNGSTVHRYVYKYDPIGNVLTRTVGGHRHNYDAKGKLLSSNRSINETQTYSYVEGTGLISRKAVTDTNATVIKDGYSLQWDSLGSVTRVQLLPENSYVDRNFGPTGLVRLYNSAGAVTNAFGPEKYEREGTMHRLKIGVANLATVILEGSQGNLALKKVLHKDVLGTISFISQGRNAPAVMPLYFDFGLHQGEDFAATEVEGFTGQRKKEYGPLYDYGARLYDPEGTMRFVSPDPLVPDLMNPQDWNAYAYARNNPINGNDPDGRRTCQVDQTGADICENPNPEKSPFHNIIVDSYTNGKNLNVEIGKFIVANPDYDLFQDEAWLSRESYFYGHVMEEDVLPRFFQFNLQMSRSAASPEDRGRYTQRANEYYWTHIKIHEQDIMSDSASYGEDNLEFGVSMAGLGVDDVWKPAGFVDTLHKIKENGSWQLEQTSVYETWGESAVNWWKSW